MSATTTAPDVFTVVRATIAPELDRALAASRARPLPASPSSLAAEPGHSRALFTRLLEAVTTAAPSTDRPTTGQGTPADTTPTTSSTAADPAGATVTELLAAYADGATTPTAVLAALAPLWTTDAVWSDAVLRLVAGADAAATESTRRWAECAVRGSAHGGRAFPSHGAHNLARSRKHRSRAVRRSA